MPSQLNGKRNVAPHAPTQPALPPQRYGGRSGLLASRLQSRCTRHWRLALPGRSPGSLRQPGYRPTSGPSLVLRPCRTRPRGSGRVPLVGLLTMLDPPQRRCARRARRASPRFSSRLSPVSRRRRRRRLDPVVITATREPQALEPQHRRHRRHRRRNDPQQHAPIRSRTCCAASPACSSPATAARARPRATSSAAPSTNSTVVLVDGVRVGSATLGQAEFEALSLAQIDRIEVLRGPASSLYGADARRRRGPDLHAPRRGRAARHAAPRRSAATTRAQGDLGVSGSQGSFDYAVSLAGEKSDGVSAIRPGDVFGTFNPDDDGFSRNSGRLRLGFTPAAGPSHRRQPARDPPRTRSTTRPSSTPQFNPDPSPDFRNRLKTRVAALDYRGAVTGSWTTTVQLGHSVDDVEERRHHDHPLQDRARPGDLAERARARARPAARARLRAPATSVPAAMPSPSRRSGTTTRSCRLLGPLRRDRRPGRRAPRRQLGLRRQHHRPDRPELRADARAEAAGARRHDASARRPSTTCSIPDYGIPPGTPGFEIKPEEGRSFEIGASWESGETRLSITAYYNKIRQSTQPERRTGNINRNITYC